VYHILSRIVSDLAPFLASYLHLSCHAHNVFNQLTFVMQCPLEPTTSMQNASCTTTCMFTPVPNLTYEELTKNSIDATLFVPVTDTIAGGGYNKICPK